MNAKTALLIIDVQVNMFDERMPVYKADEILANVQAVLALAREAELLTVFVQHDGGEGAIDEHGEEGWQLHPELLVRDEDILIEKRQPNAFEGTNLQEVLVENGIEAVIIVGMQTDYCINATVRHSAELGYQVTLISDAHTTLDSETHTAAELIAEHNEALTKLVTACQADDLILKK